MAGDPIKRERAGLDPHPWRSDPAHPNSRPPFEPNNVLGVRSGAWSERLVAETMDELRPVLQHLIDEAEWIVAIDAWAVEDYLRDRARLVRLERWLAEHGDRYPAGHKRAGELRDRDLREVGALQNRCLAHRSRLGLDPSTRDRMRLDRAAAWDVASVMALLAERAVEAGEDA